MTVQTIVSGGTPPVRMDIQAREQDSVSFGPFRLAPARRLLTLDGAPVPLGDRALEILLLLVEHAPNVVGKRTLFDRVWPGMLVDESNLRFQMRMLRKALGQDERYISTVAGRGYCFVAPVVRAQGAARRAAPANTNLPQPPTAIVERERELAALRETLEHARLVTVIGPGGVGKTRLAIEFGWGALPEFAAGVWLIDLAPVTDPDAVASATATVLGVPLPNPGKAVEAIAAFLGDRPRLLIFDNCEYVLGGVAALVAALLAKAKGLSALATSLEALGLPAETVYRLQPLAVPPAGAADVGTYPAVDLFVRRAHAADALFALDAENTASVADICRRLDGIPLALEMAAARLRLLGVEGLRLGLGERLKMLKSGAQGAGTRHGSLLALVEWSHGLLEPRDREAFRRLAVFPGSFTLDAAFAVTRENDRDRWDILDSLGRLVDRSLLNIEQREPVRYRLLETLRLFAGELLGKSGSADAVAELHARHFANVFEAAFVDWETTPDAEWIARYRPELDNLRAALDWALAEPARKPVALALGSGGPLLFHALSLVGEGRQYFEKLVALIDPTTPPAVAASVLRHAIIFWNVIPEPIVLAYIERAAILYREQGDRPNLGIALSSLGFLYGGQGQYERAKSILAEASELIGNSNLKKARIELNRYLALTAMYMNEIAEGRVYIARAVDIARGINSFRESMCLNSWAVLENVAGNHDRAIEIIRQAVACGRATPGIPLATPLHTLALSLLLRNELEEARNCFEEAFSLLFQGGSFSFRYFPGLALLVALEGQLREAALLIGFVDAERIRRGQPQTRSEVRDYRELLTLLEKGLPSSDRKALTAQGARWDMAEATEFVSARLLPSRPGTTR